MKFSYDLLHVLGAGGGDAMSTIIGLEGIVLAGFCAAGFIAEGKPEYALGIAVGAGISAAMAAIRMGYCALYRREERKALEEADALQKQLISGIQ